MGTTLYLSLDCVIPGHKPHDRDMVLLGQLIGDDTLMAELATQLHVRSLSDFQCYAPEDLEGLGDEIDDLPEPSPVEWFDPVAALLTVRAVMAHFAAARYVIARRGRIKGTLEEVDRTDDLLTELRHMETVLTTASEHGARFRLHIGF